MKVLFVSSLSAGKRVLLLYLLLSPLLLLLFLFLIVIFTFGLALWTPPSSRIGSECNGIMDGTERNGTDFDGTIVSFLASSLFLPLLMLTQESHDLGRVFVFSCTLRPFVFRLFLLLLGFG